jgi:tetratricopeptide (TPR) repeat protein
MSLLSLSASFPLGAVADSSEFENWLIKGQNESDHKTRAMDFAKAIGRWTPPDGGQKLAEANVALGLELLSYLKEPKESIKYFSEAIRLSPGFGSAYSLRGTAYGNIHRYERALRDLQRARSINPETPFINRNLCEIYDAMGQVDLALRACDVAVNKKEPGAYAVRGHALADGDRVRDAFADCDALAGLSNPGFAVADATDLCRAYAYSKGDEKSRSIQILGDLARREPNSAIAFLYRGKVLMSRGDDVLAMSDFNQALALDTEIVEAYVDRGRLKEKAGKITDAAQDYGSACSREWNPGCAALRHLKKRKS